MQPHMYTSEIRLRQYSRHGASRAAAHNDLAHLQDIDTSEDDSTSRVAAEFRRAQVRLLEEFLEPTTRR